MSCLIIKVIITGKSFKNMFQKKISPTKILSNKIEKPIKTKKIKLLKEIS